MDIATWLLTVVYTVYTPPRHEREVKRSIPGIDSEFERSFAKHLHSFRSPKQRRAESE